MVEVETVDDAYSAWAHSLCREVRSGGRGRSERFGCQATALMAVWRLIWTQTRFWSRRMTRPWSEGFFVVADEHGVAGLGVERRVVAAWSVADPGRPGFGSFGIPLYCHMWSLGCQAWIMALNEFSERLAALPSAKAADDAAVDVAKANGYLVRERRLGVERRLAVVRCLPTHSWKPASLRCYWREVPSRYRSSLPNWPAT